MKPKDVLYNLRKERGLSQEALAEKLYVTRQAVSRWETGETLPNTDTLKLLSRLFGVSINTLLGSPRKLICQCCGMPLEDDLLGRDENGSLNESYCKWCYADGVFTYHDMDELIEVCVKHMANAGFTEEQARAHMKALLPTLDCWKNHKTLPANDAYETLKQTLIDEINGLGIESMPKVEKLNPLVGSYVNIEYPLPSGATAKFLDDDTTYLGTQMPSQDGSGRCFGVVANADLLLIATYGEEGTDPALVFYKKRG